VVVTAPLAAEPQIAQSQYVPAPQQTPAPTPVPLGADMSRSARPSFEIKKAYEGRVGNALDYSWVTGQLFYIHAEGGLWVVRFAPLDKEDRFGGSVVLSSTASMAGCREGDLVTVHGEVIDEGRASKFLGGPAYRANSIDLIARSSD
jgi:hypothetical protein